MMPLMIGGAERRRRMGTGWGLKWVHWMLLGSLSGLSSLYGVPVVAQISYTVFPAKVSDGAVMQPANTGAGAHVTLAVQDSTVKYVVTEIARQAHLRPFYDDLDPRFAKRVTVRITDASMMDAFAMALKGTGLIAKVMSNRETVAIRAQGGGAAERVTVASGTIAGRVTDSASGAGLGGAAVKVDGTKLSAVTSDSGNFTLKDVPAGEQVLTVKLFGYRPATRTVTVVDGGRTPIIHIPMVSVPTVLSGVVTTASGVQKQIEVGNDITTLNVDSIRQVAPVTSVTDLLETRVPGLTVVHSSGAPGDPSRLRLRGAGSPLGNNDPVVIVDGIRVYASQSDPRNNNLAPSAVSLQPGGNFNPLGNSAPAFQSSYKIGSYNAPSPLDQVDPASIETIEVMKGPSASALYGSDAANGVIIITTKHGRAGPTHWTATLGAGVNWIPGTWPTNMFRFGSNVVGDRNHLALQGQCAWNDLLCKTDSLVTFQALNHPQYTPFSHGQDQTADLTVSGGVSMLTYSVTGSGTSDVGNLRLPDAARTQFQQLYGPAPRWMLHPENYQTVGVTGTITAQPSPTLHVTFNSSVLHGDQQHSSLLSALQQLEGGYVDSSVLASQSLLQDPAEQQTDHSLTSMNAITVGWTPRPWLPITATGGTSGTERTDNTYIPFGIHIGEDPRGARCVGVPSPCFDTTGSFGLGRGTAQELTAQVGTTIHIGRLLALGLGGQARNESTNDFTAYTNTLAPGVSSPSDFPTDGCLTHLLNQVNPCSTFSQSTSGTNTYGWYVEPRLNFANRFFVAPGFRLDGGSGGSHASYSGSGLSPGGLSTFPKIDFSYLAVDRPTGQPFLGAITQLRPRVAFGYAGTQPGLADRLRLYNIGKYTIYQPGSTGALSNGNDGNGIGGLCGATLSLDGLTTVNGVCLDALGNTQLRPEEVRELEGGVDADLWHQRVTLRITLYNKLTHDAILAVPVSLSVATTVNGSPFAVDQNIGDVLNTGTEATLGAVVLQRQAFSWNVDVGITHAKSTVTRVAPQFTSEVFDPGQGTRVVVGYPLFGEWQRPIASFVDANHDGIIEPSEVRLADSAVYVGQPAPKYALSFNTGLALLHGRLRANATFAYQNGMTQNNYAALSSGSFYLLPNNPATPLATQAAIVATSCNQFSPCGYSAFGSLIGLVQTVNTFRFNSLSIAYDVPKALSTRVRVPRMTLDLQGSNLGLHSNYRGKDPSVNAFSTVSNGDETADTGQIPEPRTWWLKLSIGN